MLSLGEEDEKLVEMESNINDRYCRKKEEINRAKQDYDKEIAVCLSNATIRNAA